MRLNTDKKDEPKKEISQAGKARINLAYYALFNFKKAFTELRNAAQDAVDICSILGQNLLFHVGLDDEDICKYHREHIDNIINAAKNSHDKNTVKMAEKILETLPFVYNEKGEIVVSKTLGAEMDKMKNKSTEGFI